LKNKILLFCMVLIISGCGDMPNDQITGTYNHSVNAILSTGNSTQRIYFKSAVNLYDSYILDDYTDTSKGTINIDNAEVTVNGYAFENVIDSEGYSYYGLYKSGFIQPDNEYYLSITYGDEIITGSTKVPKAFSIISPSNGLTIELTGESQKIEVKWGKSTNAKGYIYQIIYSPVLEVWSEGVYYWYQYRSTPKLTNDTCFTMDITSKYDWFTVKVGAYDANFENYYINQYYSSGVNGTFGVFCSMAADSVMFYVTKSRK
jgi:hypothetical protein